MILGFGSSGGDLNGRLALQMAPSGGRLFVPPAFYQVASDTARQINADNDRVLFGWYQDVDMALASFAVYITAEATQGNLEYTLKEADSAGEPTGSALANATFNSGGAADAWVTVTLGTAYQLARGKRYVLDITREAASSTDASLSTNINSATEGSAHPDGCWSKISTDGGSSWSDTTATTGNYVKTELMNIILNPQGDGVPSLWYCRNLGKYSTLLAGIAEIPEAGISLDCSALTAGTEYWIYLYNNAGTLTLEASTTGWVMSNGKKVQSGATTKALAGKIEPKDALGGGDVCPVDVMDQRLVAYPGMVKKFGKPNWLAADTASATGAFAWRKWQNNDNWKISGIGNSIFLMSQASKGSNGYGQLGISVDTAAAPHPDCNVARAYYNHNSPDTEVYLQKLGIHTHECWPLYATSASQTWGLADDLLEEFLASFEGYIRWDE